jgi:acyl-coenzyme A thioesterase PaaI-like protein
MFWAVSQPFEANVQRPRRHDLPDSAEPAVRHPEAPAPGEEIGQHYAMCFACGENQPHGLHMRMRAGEGVSVSAEFTVTEAHQGAPGLAHGGVLASALDEALGCLNWLTRVVSVTGHLETDYRRPVPVGATLHLTAWADGVSGRKIYCSAEARLGAPDGPVAVHASSIYIMVGLDHFTTHGRAQDVDAVLKDENTMRAVRAFEINP